MNDKKMGKRSPIVGFPEECKRFFDSHPKWLETYGRLVSTLTKIFIREFEFNTSKGDHVVFLLGNVCVQDFNEIYLLSANGYGFGASKLLRGLYERAVTAAYVSKNPNEAQLFLEYGFVHTGKLAIHTRQWLGDDITTLDPARIADAEEKYKLYKDNFKELVCKNCETYRIRMSWSSLDPLSMARQVNMQNLYVPCYVIPTMEIHATAQSMSSRLEINDDGSIRFNTDLQPGWAERCLVAAHTVLLRVIETQNAHFNLNLTDEIEARKEDFMAVWSKSANSRCGPAGCP